MTNHVDTNTVEEDFIPMNTSNAMTDEQTPILTAENLSKHFGAIRALDQISCHISGSSIFGLIGSNGAGKSTFLRDRKSVV